MGTTERDTSLDLFIALNRAAQWANAHIDLDIKRYGMNRTEFGVVELLYHKGSQPLQQIGSKVLMSSGNITYVVDKLEKKGFVQRRACTEDRRLIYADLTEAGERMIEEVFPQHAEVIRRAMGGLDEEEKKAASRLLKKLGKYAEEGFQ